MSRSDKGRALQPGSGYASPPDLLSTLVGEWEMEAVKGDLKLRGKAVFEWQEGNAFLVQRSSFAPAELPPAATMIIGRDESDGTYSILYHDSRGVSRVLAMSLDPGAWKLWRKAPDFSQRFTGTFDQDGRTIRGCWEKSFDGSNWELDFDLTYTKLR